MIDKQNSDSIPQSESVGPSLQQVSSIIDQIEKKIIIVSQEETKEEIKDEENKIDEQV